jgi:hypothetical protein
MGIKKVPTKVFNRGDGTSVGTGNYSLENDILNGYWGLLR